MEMDYEKLFSELITSFSLVLDMNAPNRSQYAWRLASLSARLAQKSLPNQQMEVFYAALLHDIGKIGIDEDNIHIHPRHGAEIVSRIPKLERVASIILDHHEWWDGTGYPNGKKADDIHQAAQLVRIADSFLTLHFAYPTYTRQEIYEELLKNVNKEYSKSTFDAFRDTIEDEDFYNDLMKESSLPVLLNKIQDSLPKIGIEPRSDAVGKTLRIFAQVIDSRQDYTLGHSEQVAKYAIKMAKVMGLPHDEITKIKWASLLHGAGKISIPIAILEKTDLLDTEEFEKIKQYPVINKEIISNIQQIPELGKVVGASSERWDGSGYPEHLRREEIPMLARIMTVADALDAMTSPRSYHIRRTVKDALEVIRTKRGSQFAPDVVKAACAVFWRE